MLSEREALASAYHEHLSADDVALLMAAAPLQHASDPHAVLHDSVDDLLGDPRVYEAVFPPVGEGDPFVGASPFLTFAVAVHRAARELETTTYVVERLGSGMRAPLFDVAHLRDFLDAPWRKLFLAELLASYTRVSSGSILIRTRRGLRRQRFSEMDPVRFAGLLEVVGEDERPGILRRLGDLSLFLTGVFPDYVARRGFGPIEQGRLLRAGGAAPSATVPTDPFGGADAVALLEQLGRRWYRAAFSNVAEPVPRNIAVIGEVAERFAQARRILSLVTDRFLFHQRERWFGIGTG
jgi:hypothetical protein